MITWSGTQEGVVSDGVLEASPEVQLGARRESRTGQRRASGARISFFQSSFCSSTLLNADQGASFHILPLRKELTKNSGGRATFGVCSSEVLEGAYDIFNDCRVIA